MKTFCLSTIITALLLSIFGCTSPPSDQLTQQEKDQIKKEFKSIYDNYCAKWTGLDAEGIAPYYSPELVVVFDTLLLDYKTYMKGWSDYTKTTETIKLNPSYLDVRILTKDLVIATWCGRMERLMKSGDLITAKPAKYTDVWKRVDGQWKAIYEHGSGKYMTQKTKTTQTKLNQVELIKQFVGTWQGEIGKDTIEFQDITSFGAAIENNFKIVTKGKIIDSAKALWGYDKKNDKFINSEVLKSSPDIRMFSIWFTATNTCFAVPMSDISNPDKAEFKMKAEFKSPDVFIMTIIRNNNVVSTHTFNREKK